MKKLFVLVLLFVLFVSATGQKKGKRKTKMQVNSSEVALVNPRTFIGVPVIQTKSVLNGTQAPIPAHSPPALQSLSNSAKEYLLGPLSTRVIPIIYMLVVTVGIPANIVILGLLATKIRKVSSAILYCSLAISDLLLLFSLFFKAHYHLLGNHWVLGETACRVITACFYGNLYCSAVTLACISVKRYLAVVYPFTYKRLPKRMLAALVSLAVWGVFFIAVIPELLVQQSFMLTELNRTSCHDVLPLNESSHILLLYYNLVLTVLGLLLPLVITVVCYVKIIKELSKSHFDWTRVL
ncbi:proteinase-activated receptor 3 isoform X2 [Melanotaenia boesemani]|uniref:proteinase-activated receptor 3 isoform X2 n=1 Tax=Melanotaenia boesemani TaxID=1250792 RepID=UPI001C044B7B|nr:proteinase-activated receptor 3 isoform X2 [Melanotaenia boesemani]